MPPTSLHESTSTGIANLLLYTTLLESCAYNNNNTLLNNYTSHPNGRHSRILFKNTSNDLGNFEEKKIKLQMVCKDRNPPESQHH